MLSKQRFQVTLATCDDLAARDEAEAGKLRDFVSLVNASWSFGIVRQRQSSRNYCGQLVLRKPSSLNRRECRTDLALGPE
jgi:hypothetical protein